MRMLIDILKHSWWLGLLVLGAAANPVFNEVMTGNSGVVLDQAGEDDDWIEIFNPGPNAVNLSGYYVSDDPGSPTKHQISGNLNVAAGGFALLWADEDPDQGVNHLGFKLSKSGESLTLTAPNGVTVLDSVTVPPLADNRSYARSVDGGPT